MTNNKTNLSNKSNSNLPLSFNTVQKVLFLLPVVLISWIIAAGQHLLEYETMFLLLYVIPLLYIGLNIKQKQGEDYRKLQYLFGGSSIILLFIHIHFFISLLFQNRSGILINAIFASIVLAGILYSGYQIFNATNTRAMMGSDYLPLKNELKKRLKNNRFLPLSRHNISLTQGFGLAIIPFLICFMMATIPYSISREEMRELTENNIQRIQEELTERGLNELNFELDDFKKRNLNIWINLKYYFAYEDKLREGSEGEYTSDLPEMEFPLICKIIGKETLDPVNAIEIIRYIRGAIGSGLTIRTRDWIFKELDCSDMTTNQVVNTLNAMQGDLVRIARFQITGMKNGEEITRVFDTNYVNFPNFSQILPGYFDRDSITHTTVYRNVGRVLRHTPNSRIMLPPEEIPMNLKLAFVLVEDDNFFVEPGGIDFTGLIGATFNYFLHDSQKGNASITEQFYEMYLGKQYKNPFDKLKQILFAVYYTYYVPDRGDVLDTYVQSIPGSFWGDHCYGVSAIAKNYLNKDDLSSLSPREIAWLTRIAMQPNNIGQNLARYHIVSNMLASEGFDINNEEDVRLYISLKEQAGQSLMVGEEEQEAEQRFTITEEQVIRFKEAYEYATVSIDTALLNFYLGNAFVEPLLNESGYLESLQDRIVFQSPKSVNLYQAYTDQTKFDIKRLLGLWGLNAGLDVTVHMDEASQRVITQEINWDADELSQWGKEYGGSAILLQTHDIRTSEPLNHLVAICVRHAGDGEFFNWAVTGMRHFGSIFKWIILAMYFDGEGTPKDYYYDIPREWPTKNQYNEDVVFTPDNWRANHRDIYGFFTFRRQNMMYNFVQSKNNTFVEVLDRVGLRKAANLINEWAEYEPDYRWRVRPIYPLVLGSETMSTVKFAQILSMIANHGVFKPVTTIDSILRPGDVEAQVIDLPERQAISPEAAEMCFYAGYLNPYFGTAKKFWRGGSCKTGSYERKAVSFVALTSRGPNEYIEENPDHLLNANLLYLVEIGVNKGRIGTGLLGGIRAAANAARVFEFILEKTPDGQYIHERSERYDTLKERFRYPISSFDIVNNVRSQRLELIDPEWEYEIDGVDVLMPMPIGRDYYVEPAIPQEELEEMQCSYEARVDMEFVENLETRIRREVLMRRNQFDVDYNTPFDVLFEIWSTEIYQPPEEYVPRVNLAAKYEEIIQKWELQDMGFSNKEIEEILEADAELRQAYFEHLHTGQLVRTEQSPQELYEEPFDVDYYTPQSGLLRFLNSSRSYLSHRPINNRYNDDYYFGRPRNPQPQPSNPPEMEDVLENSRNQTTQRQEQTPPEEFDPEDIHRNLISFEEFMQMQESISRDAEVENIDEEEDIYSRVLNRRAYSPFNQERMNEDNAPDPRDEAPINYQRNPNRQVPDNPPPRQEEPQDESNYIEGVIERFRLIN